MLHAPPSHRHTAIPIFRALSAGFWEMPGPGKAITPIGSASRIWSLRLKAAVFLWRGEWQATRTLPDAGFQLASINRWPRLAGRLATRSNFLKRGHSRWDAARQSATCLSASRRTVRSRICSKVDQKFRAEDSKQIELFDLLQVFDRISGHLIFGLSVFAIVIATCAE